VGSLVLVVEPPELVGPPKFGAEDGEEEGASLSGPPESVLGESLSSSADSEELPPGVKVSTMMLGWVADTTRSITVAGTTTRLETNIHLLLVHASRSDLKVGKDFT
jgi:hypothetical protein